MMSDKEYKCYACKNTAADIYKEQVELLESEIMLLKGQLAHYRKTTVPQMQREIDFLQTQIPKEK